MAEIRVNHNRLMMSRVWGFGLWAAVAASAVYWGLKLFVPALPVLPHANVAATESSPRGDLSRLFGAETAGAVAAAAAEVAAPESDRFELVGVVAPRSGGGPREGIALISVDGKPPRVYRVGAVIDGDTVLQAVERRGASLGPSGGASNIRLDIPPPALAATGVPQPAAGAVIAPPRALPPAFTAPPPVRPMQPRALLRQSGASEPQGMRGDAVKAE